MSCVTNDLVPWLVKTLDERGWSQRELARRSNVSSTTVSEVVSYRRIPTWEFCATIAQALNVPPVEVFALAGLMHAPPSPVEGEEEFVSLLRRLPASARNTVVSMLRGLVRELQPNAVVESRVEYRADDALVDELLAEFDQVPEEWQETVIAQVAQMRRLAEREPRVIGDAE